MRLFQDFQTLSLHFAQKAANMTADFKFLLQVPPPAVGKLNLNDFQKVSAALQSKRPVPASEDIDQHGYAVPKDTMGGVQEKSEYAAPVDLQEPKPASRSKPRHRERRERASHPGKEIKFFFNFL